MKAEESKEFHQVNQENPTLIEKSSLVVTKDGQVTQETIKASSSVSATPKLTRKSTAPRFVTPVQGKIVDQAADVELEGVVDGSFLRIILRFLAKTLNIFNMSIN